MIRTALIIAWVLLGGITQAARHQITSLPYTASTDYDTLTLAGTRLEGNGNGIRVTGRHVLIDLRGDTLEFGADNGDGYYGLSIRGGAHHVTVSGGTIRHGGGGDQNQCLLITRANDVLIDGTDMIVGGTNGHCVETASVGEPGCYNFEINGGDYWNLSHGYSSRCQYDGCAIRIHSTSYGGYGEFHYKIHDITLHDTPGQGILVTGRNQTDNSALTFIYDNVLTGDARNSFYEDCAIAACGTCRSAANPYMIAMLKCAPGSQCFNNVITSGTQYGGCRGILIENCTGSSTNRIRVYDNVVDVHEGPNVEYGEGLPVHGLRMRNIDGGSLSHISVSGNRFICTGDDVSYTSSYNNAVMPLRYSNDTPLANVTIENNLFRAKSNTGGVYSMAMVFDYVTADETLVVRRNRIEGDGTLVQFGNSGGGASGITLEGDTLAFLSPAYNPEVFHVGYLSNSFMCTDNRACDVVCPGAASDTNIIMANGGTLELGLEKTVTITVLGNNGLPVPNASVQIISNYGRIALSKYTGGHGLVSGPVTYWWEQRLGSDSTSYNPFTVRVQKGDDITQSTMVISENPATSTLVLQNTVGEECETCDYTCGDFNHDELINLVDLLLMIEYVYLDGDSPEDTRVIDVNSDNSIDLLDILCFTDYSYNGGSPLICPE